MNMVVLMKKYSIDNPMAPPWIKYPHIPQKSIGWCMGYVEGYTMDFSDWYEKLSENDKLKYQKMFPSPKTWIYSYTDHIDDNCFEDYFYKGINLWRKNGENKYSKKKLLTIIREYNDFVFFWNLDNTLESCFSQWIKSDFVENIDKYNCAEQYMMVEKARFFGDSENRKKIMESDDPFEMKKLGRKIRNFNSKEWDKVKYSIVLNGNY
jgi:hypothetical protein